jgi:hypothetical protein
MVKICANSQFDVLSSGPKMSLCARVKKVNELFIGLNAGGQPKYNNKNSEEEISPIDLGTFMHEIKTISYHDLIKLQADQKFAFDEKAEILDEVLFSQPRTAESFNARGNLARAFGQIFGQIIEDLKSVKIANNVGEHGTIESQKAVYKLLCIGYHMRVEYWKVEENLTWAFQQTVVNLAIHALRLDQPSQREIQQIAASWPAGILVDEEIVEPSQGHDSA